MTMGLTVGHDREVSIDFFTLTDEESWEPLRFDQAGPGHFCADGRPLSESTTDYAAVFDGAMSISTKIDPAFNLIGLRCRAGFAVPAHDLNLRQLTIVLVGELLVTGDDEEPRRLGRGQFVVSPAQTALRFTAGPDGATYVVCWPQPVASLQTLWHEG